MPASPSIKPLPALPSQVTSAPPHIENAPYRDDDDQSDSDSESEDVEPEPYRDEPPTPRPASATPATTTSNAPIPAPLSILPPPPQYQPYNHQYAVAYAQQYPAPPFTPYTDTPPTPGDDDVPLAHLIPSSPFYATAQAQLAAQAQHFLASEQPYPMEAPPPYAIAVRQTHTYHHRETLIQIPRDPFAQYVGRDEESGMLDSEAEESRHTIENVVAMFVVATMLLVVAAMFGWLAWGGMTG